MLAIKLIESRIIVRYPELLGKTSIKGLPKDIEGARALFHEDPWDFEYWVAVHLLEGRPPVGKTKESMKGADKGIDGIITLVTDIENGQNIYGKAVVQVKGGHLQRGQVATFKSDVDTAGAASGIFVCLESPTGPMKEEAAKAGMVRTKFGEFPKIQLLTVDELIRGQRPKLPGMISSYKQAGAAITEVPQASLL